MLVSSKPGMVLATVAAIVSSLSPTAVNGQQKLYPIKADVIGCKDKGVRERLTTLRDSGDTAAYHRFGTAAFGTGACRELKAGDSAYLEVNSAFGYVCLRPYGEAVCYWTFPQAIR